MKYTQNKQKNSPLLVKLGLTPDEGRCYALLVSEGSREAKKIALSLDILPNAVYRLIDRLKEKGLIAKLDTRPVRFQAIPPKIAISALAKRKMREIEEIELQSIENFSKTQPANQTHVDLITGSKAMFYKAAELISDAKKEVLIISIGEAVPDEIRLANRDAIANNVPIKFIVHKHDEQNKDLLDSWKKMGLEVRYYPGSGYHLSIIDSQKTLLSASNPKNPPERTSMLINNEGLASAMRNYFYSLWDKAVVV